MVVQLRPEDHPLYSASLNYLGNGLSTRFEQRGDGKPEDPDEAIEHRRTVLQLMPEGCPDHSASLNNLADALSTRFEQRGDGRDLEEAIQHRRTALQLMPKGHPLCSSSHSDLAKALSTQFDQQGDSKDLDEAIEHHRTALQLRPEDHPLHSFSLICLANALSTRFDQQGDGKDIDEAIQHHRTALQLRPEGHPDHSSSLIYLADALSTRFDQQGDGKDIDEAIQHHRTALQLRPEGHPDHISSLSCLANALSTRFDHQGDGKDLDEAVQHHRTALQLRPEGHPDHSSSLIYLADSLSTRFNQQGNGKDLDEAIQHHRTALKLMPKGHSDHPAFLNNLSIALSTRFDQQGDAKDLDEAIQYDRIALQLRPEGHPDHSASLHNLAHGLLTRFEYQGDAMDLDEAIEHNRTALQLRPEGHPDHSSSLNSLARALLIQFEQQGDEKDLDEAIQHNKAALQLRPEGHPDHSTSLSNLANALLTRFEQQVAEEHLHPSALDAYTQSLYLLDSHISTTTTISSRHQIRMHFPQDLSVNAASCALRQGNICHAIELLEQGRALHWTQLARLRTTLDNLQSCDAKTALLANQLQDLSAMLNRPADVSVDENCSIAAVEAKARHYRDLVEQWNRVVEEIRTLKGFSQFLLPPLFTDLQVAACKGPVIVLVASKFSCDAIIVLHTQSPIHIQLQITWEEVDDLVTKHLQNIHNSHGPDHNIFVETMGTIWKMVILPVVYELKKYVQKHSRIWWCEYQPGGSVLSKLFVSSYIPSLSALIKAHRGVKITSDVKFAAIGQAAPDMGVSFQPLQYVEPELDKIEELLPTAPVRFTRLTGSESTRQQALNKLQEHQWFHLSCHGKQEINEPFKSYFAMHDAPLSLLDIINADLSGHEFAFLSACETAMGDSSAPDEVIHLAAGLQFMG
ncbi:hypothetical protein BU15DRAFT_88916 [Melanogaster broomeanus]|nr:hypothetical protein BU15DRAFT_88916 [Melanogaster broomeanus]